MTSNSSYRQSRQAGKTFPAPFQSQLTPHFGLFLGLILATDRFMALACRRLQQDKLFVMTRQITLLALSPALQDQEQVAIFNLAHNPASLCSLGDSGQNPSAADFYQMPYRISQSLRLCICV